MPKVTQQYRDARREHILDAARRCFVRKGFHATSMQDLFAEAELSSGAVYRYFASKDDMIVAIAQENLREVVAMVHAAASRGPARSAGDVVAEVLDLIRAKHARDGLGGLAVLVWAEALSDPSLAARFDTLLGQMRHDLADVIAEGERGRPLPVGVSAGGLARVLLSTVPGYILQLALFGEHTVQGIPETVRALWP
jgi:AcrR family transcriptional regulator